LSGFHRLDLDMSGSPLISVSPPSHWEKARSNDWNTKPASARKAYAFGDLISSIGAKRRGQIGKCGTRFPLLT